MIYILTFYNDPGLAVTDEMWNESYRLKQWKQVRVSEAGAIWGGDSEKALLIHKIG